MKLSRTILMLLVVFVAGSVATLGIGWGTKLIAFPKRAEAAALKTFPDTVAAALAQVPSISPADASAAIKANPDTLVIDVRDAADIASTGIIPGAVNISLGTLTFKADNQVPPEWRDPRLANRARPIITTCYSGEMGAVASKLLADMGFTNVRSLKGGTVAWKDAGLPTNPLPVKAAAPATFPDMVTVALAQVPAISPAEASDAMKSNPDTLVIDVRDAADIAATGIIPGAVNISLGTLTFKADTQVPPELRDPRLANRARPIITTCASGAMGALAGKLLTDMGFTNVRVLKGGTLAWKAAGYPTNPLPVKAAAPTTFPDTVAAALAQVPAISPADASAAIKANPDTLVIDVRDAADIAATGIIPGAVNISLGTLTFKADNQVPPELRDPRLANRARPIITTCTSGAMGALAGKLLTDMGFTNVRTLKGGTVAWKDAGLPTNPLPVKAAAPTTFPDMVAAALAQVPAISPAEASAAMKANPDTLVIDVRDAADIASTGIIPGAVNISLGTLTFKADTQVPPELRDPRLANRARPIITTCTSGAMGALAGKLLTDMGFTNVRALKGGTLAWKAAGYPTN